MAKYGIKDGQRYVSADGSAGFLIVVDCEKYADIDDVVVRDNRGIERRIDSFKLAMVRYMLDE